MIERTEMKCPCCGAEWTQDNFLEKLNEAQRIAKVRFEINSGCRCPGHNEAVGGSKNSSHMLGLAADIKAANSRTRFRIVYGLVMAGFTRFSVKVERGFIHVDLDEQKAQEVIW